MPFAVRDGVRLYWRLEGNDADAPLVLLNSIGCDLCMWDRAMPLLLGRFRVLRIDSRGHGASDAPDGDYTLAMLAADVAGVMDEAGIAQAAVAGVSLGGMVALQLALDAPDRVASVIPICTGIAFDPSVWTQRIAAVRREGMAAIVDSVLARFLDPSFIATSPAMTGGVRRMVCATPAAGYAGAAAAIRDMDLPRRLGAITVPVLVVSGSRDVAAPAAEHGRVIAAAIAGAVHVEIAAAHLAPVENPGAVVTAINGFLSGDEDAAQAAATVYEAGLVNRRRVLGDDWVDRSLASRTPFNTDFQAMITRIAWHEVWGRPGLDERTRRLLVVAITAALGRWEEFTLHVRAGLTRGGFTEDELKEVLMQTAIYAGVPAANTAFAEAGSIVAELAAKRR